MTSTYVPIKVANEEASKILKPILVLLGHFNVQNHTNENGRYLIQSAVD